MLASLRPGHAIRTLRVARRLSQEALARRADISPRHLSCVETGRARPSHATLLALGEALDLPLRERNTLLAAAGFAPFYRTSPLDDPSMAHVHQAIAHIFRLHEPHPAMVLDREWNVVRMNAGALRLFAWCEARLAAGRPPNALRVLFDPALGLRRWIANFDALADAALSRVRTEAAVDPSCQALLAELEALRGPSNRRRDLAAPSPVALPVHLRREGEELRYFTTLTTLGTPLDVTAQELRIEGYFPMDDATDAFARRLARDLGAAPPRP